MSASAISLAKLIAEQKGLSESQEPEVPSNIELPATTVTKENVASLQHLGYRANQIFFCCCSTDVG
jgi:ribose transport system substrate-binding protein